jgi:hypothetical protein
VIELDDESTRGGMSIKTVSSWAEANVPVLADLSKARQNINTPRRLKLGAMLSVFSETSSEPLGGFESIDLLDEVEGGRAKLRLIVDKWKKIVWNFESLADEHQRRSTDEIKY